MLQKEEGWRHCILLLICAFDKFYIQKIACCVLVQKIVSVGPPWIEILATPLHEFNLNQGRPDGKANFLIHGSDGGSDSDPWNSSPAANFRHPDR